MSETQYEGLVEGAFAVVARCYLTLAGDRFELEVATRLPFGIHEQEILRGACTSQAGGFLLQAETHESIHDETIVQTSTKKSSQRFEAVPADEPPALDLELGQGLVPQGAPFKVRLRLVSV